MESVWDRLRSRKIVEWTIAYLAGGFGLLQLADFMKEAFGWPTTVLRVLTVVVTFGLFAMVVVAWYHGEKGHQRVPSSEIALLALIGFLTFGFSWYVAVTSPVDAAGGVAGGSPVATDSSDIRLALFDPATATSSIAVLPFVNMTPSTDNEYLTDGITEDIITELGRIEGLRVISRTSVMRYKVTDKSIGEIAAELSVGTILEGSVRVQGDRVRIVAQLIDAATDSHLWAETYDRDIKDIFAVQSEVARAIAKALNAELLPSSLAATEEVPTVDPDAYRMYQMGKSLSNAAAPADIEKAVAYLDSAIARDPDFAQAWAARADLELPAMSDAAMPASPTPPLAGAMISAAVEKLEDLPRHAEARSAIQMMRAIGGHDMAGAERAAREAIRANPNSVRDRMRYAQILYAKGEHDRAMRELNAAARLDPLSPYVHTQMGEYAMAAGRTDEAETHLERAVELDSASPFPHVALGLLYHQTGRPDEAMRELETAERISPNDPAVLGPVGWALGQAGYTEAAKRIVVKLEEGGGSGRSLPTVIAQVYAGIGDVAGAAEWLKKGARTDSTGRNFMFASPRFRGALERIGEDPRMARLLDSLGIVLTVRAGPADSTRNPRSGSRGSRSRSDGRQ